MWKTTKILRGFWEKKQKTPQILCIMLIFVIRCSFWPMSVNTDTWETLTTHQDPDQNPLRKEVGWWAHIPQEVQVLPKSLGRLQWPLQADTQQWAPVCIFHESHSTYSYPAVPGPTANGRPGCQAKGATLLPSTHSSDQQGDSSCLTDGHNTQC